MENLRNRVAELKANKKRIDKELVENSTALNDAVEYKKSLDIAQKLINDTALEVQDEIKYSLEDIVNMMLDAMFPDMYQFKLVYEVNRGRTEARIAIVDNGREVSPLKSLGGGVCDCISTSLRIALLLLTTKQRILILDEPGKFLSVSIRPAFYEILEKLSKDLGIQIITVTHDSHAIDVADKIYTVVKEDSVSKVLAP